MRILIIHLGVLINNTGGDCVRTENMASSLLKLGNRVYILYLYSILKLRFDNLKFINKQEGVTRIYIPTLPISKLCSIGQYINNIIVWAVYRLLKIDLVQAEISWSASITKLISKPLITDFHSDIVPELESTGGSKSFINKSIKDNIYALNNSDSIICVSKTLEQNLIKGYSANSNSFILPCCVNLDHFNEERLSARSRLRKEYNLEGRIVLCYQGSTHQWQCLDETFDIFLKLKSLDERYFFCLFTKDNLDKFRDRIEACQGSFMTKSLDKNDVVENLSIIDAGFVIRENLTLNVNSSPTKTSEYMAAGAMVIATQFSGDTPELIKESQSGFIIDSTTPSQEEVSSLHKSICDYVSDYSSKSTNIKKFIKARRSWSNNEDILREIYSRY